MKPGRLSARNLALFALPCLGLAGIGLPLQVYLPPYYSADLGLNRRRSFMTARLALVGKPVSPPLDDTMAALGAQRTVQRLRQAAAAIDG